MDKNNESNSNNNSEYTPQNIGSDSEVNKIDEDKDQFKTLNLGSKFWFEDYNVLFDKKQIFLFIPSDNMSLIEKLNAIFRLSIILSLALYLFTSNYNYLYIGIIFGAITVFIYKYQKDNVELYINTLTNDKYNKFQEDILKEEKFKSDIIPTVNNPFMNINLITSDKTQEAPPSSWNDDDIKTEINDKFNYNLYRDVSDLYGKSNSQRQYYTTPSTTIPNNQTGFAKWLYGQGPTCKEKSIYCAPEMPAFPYLDTNNPYKDTNQKY